MSAPLTLPAPNEALTAIMRSFDFTGASEPRLLNRLLAGQTPRRPSANRKAKIQNRKS